MNFEVTKQGGEPMVRISTRSAEEIEQLKRFGAELETAGLDSCSYSQGNGDWNVCIFDLQRKP